MPGRVPGRPMPHRRMAAGQVALRGRIMIVRRLEERFLALLPPLSAGCGRGPAFALVPVALDQPAEARRFATEAGLPDPLPVEVPGPADSSVRLGNRAGVLGAIAQAQMVLNP